MCRNTSLRRRLDQTWLFDVAAATDTGQDLQGSLSDRDYETGGVGGERIRCLDNKPGKPVNERERAPGRRLKGFQCFYDHFLDRRITVIFSLFSTWG